jgi:SpoVK/Ycf46/Vps4 family AAA+-type ATPase
MVCVFEDIDATIEKYGDGELLQWLDGNCQVDNAVNLASTNYPEKLDPHVVARPRRFDRVLEIKMPTDSQREAYLRRKLVHLADVEILDWVHRTAGLSFASLAELIISVCCLANDFDQTIEILRNQHGSGSFRVDGFEKARKSSETIGTTSA